MKDAETDRSKHSEERIKAKIESAFPDEKSRLDALRLFAFAVENANDERSDGWCVRDVSGGLVLMAGRVTACKLAKGAVELSVLGPIPQETRTDLGALATDSEDWKYIPGGLVLTIPAERAANALALLKDAFDRFVDLVMVRVKRTVNLEATHIPEAVEYVSKAIGQELPQPEPRGAASEVAEDEEPIDDVRAPTPRGRPPIFETGPRMISSLLDEIERNVVALPDLQRPFVWADTKVRDLLDSLFLGFPVGTLILWQTADEKEARALGAERRELRASTLVIDGQQRLTSLYAVMKGAEVTDKDGTKRRIEIAFRPRDGRFDVCDAFIRQDPEYIADISQLWRKERTRSQVRKELISGLKARGREIDDAHADAIEHNLERAHALSEYQFPTIFIRKADATDEDVADIFVRINNSGKPLGQADFVLTLLAVFHGALRDRIVSRSQEMSTESVVEIDTQHILRAACAVGFGRARMPAIYRYLRGMDPTTREADPNSRKERLETLDKAADDCLAPLTWRDFVLRVKHAGFINPSLVASPGSVVYAYAIYVLGRRNGVKKPSLDEFISRWLFASLLTARYSYSSETVFERDWNCPVLMDTFSNPRKRGMRCRDGREEEAQTS